EEILEDWPGDVEPNRNHFFAALKAGLKGGRWARTGAGKKGDPHRYYRCGPRPETGPDAADPFGDGKGVATPPPASDEEAEAGRGELLVYLHQCGPCDVAKLAHLSNRDEESVKRDLFTLWEKKMVLRAEKDGAVIYSLNPERTR